MISFKQLRYALALQKHLHFRRAAEACSVSQSTLSTAISELEKQLGLAIFERDNKKVLITAVGHKILAKAQEIHLQLTDLLELADEQTGVLSHPLSIGMIPTICPFLLPIVLPTIQEIHPSFEARVLEEQSHALVEKVRNGELDTAVIALPYPTTGLLTFEFWQEDFYWIVHQDSFKSTKKSVSPEELVESHLMLLQEGHCLKDHALSACKLISSDTHSLSATSLNTLIQLVIGKAGSTLIPQMALEQLVSNNPMLRALKLSEPSPHRRIAFIVRPNYTGVKNIEALIEIFKSNLEEHIDKP